MRPSLRVSLAAIALAGVSSGAITSVRVGGVTATQAVLEYVAPDTNPCIVAISESASLTPLAHDVDTTLFSASNSDSRPGSVVSGRARTFVAGTRTAEKALDNKYYSRALQNNTVHSFSVTCGSDVATGSFRTANLPAGLSFTPPTAVADPLDPAVEAIPTFEFGNRNQKIVDPLTGTLIRHMGFTTQESIGGTGDYPFAYAAGTNWTNAENIKAGDGTFATYSAGGSDPICVRSDWVFDAGKQFGGITFELTGKVDDSTTAPQQDVEVAMSLDGCQTANSPWLTMTLPKAASYNPPFTDVTAGDDKANPVPVMAAWLVNGQAPPTVLDVSMRTGTVNTDGTAVDWTTPGGSNVFPFNWGPGTPIEINTTGGSPPYTAFNIESLQNALKLTLTTSAGTHTNAAFRSPTFSFMIRPKVAAARTISLDYARIYINMYAGLRLNGGDGMSTMCSMKATPEAAVINGATNTSPIQISVSTAQTWNTGDTIIVAGVVGNTNANGTWTIHKIDTTHFTLDSSSGNGVYTKRGIAYPPNARTGYQCAHLTALPGDWQYFWIATSDGSGDAHYLGPLRVSGSSNGAVFSGICGGNTVSWDWITDPVYPTVYCVLPDYFVSSKSLLLSATYTGSPANGFNADVGPLPNAGNSDTYASWDIQALSTDLTAAYTAFEPRYDAAAFGAGNVDGFQDGHVTLVSRGGTQDTAGWRIVFDPVTRTVSAMMSSFLQLPAAYCSIHTSNTNTFNPFITTTLKNLISEGGGAYNGPYTSQITSDGGTGVGSVSATLNDCAAAVAAIGQANVLGVTGAHCSTVTVATDPITPGNVIPANSILMPAPIGQPMQFTSSDPFSGQFLTGERVRLIAKNGLTWVIQRAYYDGTGSPPPSAQPAGSLLEPMCGALVYQMLPPLNQDCCLVWWDWKNDPHGTNPNDPYAQQGGNGTSTAYPLDADPAKQICPKCTMRKEDTFARLGHYATGSNQSQTVALTINDSGNNNFFPQDSSGYPGNYWQSLAIRSQPWPEHMLQYHSTPIGITAPFAGVFGECVGNCADFHPSTNYTDDQSLMYSANPVGAFPGFPGTVTPQGAQRYKVTDFVPSNAAPLDLKRNELLIQIGRGSALNVSGPGCSIGTTSADAWKWGLVYKANECVPGSLPGEVYINAPGVSTGPVGSPWEGLYTPFDKAAPYTLARDLVVMTAGSLSDNFVQYKTTATPDIAGNRARKLTTLLNGTKNMGRTSNYRPVADATWTWSDWQANLAGPFQILLMKTPPFPPDTTVNRTDYIQIPVNLKPAAALGVTNAIVEFGYNAALDCINRTGESCVAAANNDPYFYSIADAPIAGVPCASGCTVTVQAIPQYVIYYRVKYRDAANAVIATGAVGVLTPP